MPPLASRVILLICLLAASVLFTGFMVKKFVTVGYYENSDEYFVGSIDHNTLTGKAKVFVKSEKSDVQCQGLSNVISPSFSLKNLEGELELTCTDGRQVTGTWESEGLSRGAGVAVDNKGNVFRFVFASNLKEARANLEQIRATSAQKLGLTDYDPKKQRQAKGFGTGTGFFVSESGHFITNYHVVEGASEITVRLKNGSMLPARLILKDATNDIALLKVEAKARPVMLSLKQAGRGDEVFTLGYPKVALQKQEQKAAHGRVYALDVPQCGPRFYQVDVVLAPGNAGSPLFNRCGQVIGVFSPVAVPSQPAESLPENISLATKTGHIYPVLKTQLSMAPRDSCEAGEKSGLMDALRDSVVLVITR